MFYMVTVHAVAQDRWAHIADTLRRYGAPLTYMYDDSVRIWISENEQAVGYQQCYDDYYSLLGRVAQQAAQQQDSMMYDLGMSHIFMTWQRKEIDTEKACAEMNRLKDLCLNRYGKKSFAYTTATCLMAQFYCSTGQYDAADSCYRRIIQYEDNLTLYTWQYMLALNAKLVADTGRGRLKDAWETADKIVERYDRELDIFNRWWTSEPDVMLNLRLQSPQLKIIANLAQQMTAPMFPPSPKAIANNEIAPWPIILPHELMNSRRQPVLGVFNLYEVFSRLQQSDDFCGFIEKNVDKMINAFYDINLYDSIPPPLSADMCRRLAIITSMNEERLDTIRYLHNLASNKVMTRWHQCMSLELLNYKERSALAVMRFSAEWIKKGYPLSLLPLVEEAAAIMQRDLTSQCPTLRQLIYRRQDKEWLSTKWPKLQPLLENIPEYADVIAAFNVLSQ